MFIEVCVYIKTDINKNIIINVHNNNHNTDDNKK